MPLVHYYVHGRGRGHATRSRAVIARLRDAGHDVVAFAGEAAEPLLREVVTTHAVRSLLPTSGREAPLLLAGRVRAAVSALRRERADLVISDGDLPGTLAARATGRPSIAVGHGLVFLCCARPSGIPAGPWRREALKAAVSTLGAQRRIAVGFVPLPVRRGRLARPALEPPLTAATPRTPDGPLLCYFRDGAPAALLQRLAALHVPVILFASDHQGMPGMPSMPAIPGIHHEPPSRARFVAALSSARAVIATAGSQLIGECVALGVPLLALHAPDDDEQRLNVALLRDAGLGDGAPLPELDDARLHAFLARPPVTPPAWSAPDVATAVLEEAESLLRGAR
jgi:UDP-N-acetylglucosamine--N-acetylmuramyl-(pentapeptide) pyrophosphoryl-undecaprenol N-acetylglucosamine transferase